MRRRWYYFKRTFRANRPVLMIMAAGLVILALFIGKLDVLGERAGEIFREYGVRTAGRVLKDWFPAASGENREWEKGIGTLLFSYLEEMQKESLFYGDPAYEKILTGERAGLKDDSDSGKQTEIADENGTEKSGETGSGAITAQVITMKPSGQGIVREKLADFDYVMQNFYSVHPTTTADRDLIDAEKFLSMDFSIEKDSENPTILIYHTHSQEEFSDYPENPEATITGVGTYLASLLEEKGYGVIHDTTVYDLKDGKLDRSRAYTYALDGISGILQKYPSIEVVLDIHRDGVSPDTRLVTEVNGKPTARIMFFNGTSQTPDGPIEYLPNPNREANLAFSFQLQVKASEEYPGLARKIYLKGLRYNQHVRARTALIEVGAQTNTYEEARNAMEPLSELLDQVLDSSGA